MEIRLYVRNAETEQLLVLLQALATGKVRTGKQAAIASPKKLP